MKNEVLTGKKCIVTKGGIPLSGSVKIQGSKNAALPILAASLLTKEQNLIRNCPKISDTFHMLEILKLIGVQCHYVHEGILIDAAHVMDNPDMGKAVTYMRSSLCLLGALVGSGRRVKMEYPGGCAIGKRPINLHIQALEKMGIVFSCREDIMSAYAPQGVWGAQIDLSYPSVGTTENVILAAILAQGKTKIRGAAREPEICALCEYLNGCGASIQGAGSDCIDIEGVDELHGSEYRIPSDRIVAGTYAFAVCATGGEAFLEAAEAKYMKATLQALSAMGGEYQETSGGVYVQGSKYRTGIRYLRTETYPGFPTDMQSVALAVLVTAEGDSMVEETVFENRLYTAGELEKMGGLFTMIDDHTVYIRGREHLQGAKVYAGDLRGGAALVVAGLCAVGESRIYNVEYIERGYENICRDLRELGGRIYCQEDSCPEKETTDRND